MRNGNCTPIRPFEFIGLRDVLGMLLLLSTACGCVRESLSAPAESPIKPSPGIKIPKLDPVEARKQLAQLGKDYSVGAYVGSAAQGDAIAVSYFLDAGMEVNSKSEKGMTALGMAASLGKTETIKLLLQRGADAKLVHSGIAPIVLAAYGGHLEAVKVLMEHETDPGSKAAQEALYTAVLVNYPGVVKYLVEKGVDANYVEQERGDTLLMMAARIGSAEILKVLLPKITNVNVTNALGATAMDFAFEHIFKAEPLPRTGKAPDAWPDESVRVLVKAGANVYTDYYLKLRRQFLESTVQVMAGSVARDIRHGGKKADRAFEPVRELIDMVVSEFATNGVPVARQLPLWKTAVDAIGRARFVLESTIPSVGPEPRERAAITALQEFQADVAAEYERLRAPVTQRTQGEPGAVPAPTATQKQVAPPKTNGTDKGETWVAYKPSPAYPSRAFQSRLEGKVILRVVVGKYGRPTTVEVAESSGHSILDNAAVEIVKGKWIFTPAEVGTNSVPMEFKLQ